VKVGKHYNVDIHKQESAHGVHTSGRLMLVSASGRMLLCLCTRQLL